MKKIKMVLSIGRQFLELLFTLKPKEKSRTPIKVLAKPAFLGGPATKVSQLTEIMAHRRQHYSSVFCLSAVHTPIFLLRILKLLGAKVVVNQNGVYYPSWFPLGWEEKNAYLRRLNVLSDHTFFQSEFALRSYKQWVGDLPKNYSILHNPVDTRKFLPLEEGALKNNALRVLVFADVSEFTEPLWQCVKGLLHYMEFHPLERVSVEWTLMGRILSGKVFDRHQLGELDKIEKLKIKMVWEPEAHVVPERIREHDVALHLVYNDVCPNKVLECLASGLGVIGLSAGGTVELVGDAGITLNVPQGFGKPAFPAYSELREALSSYFAQKQEYRRRAVLRAQQFDLTLWHEKVRKECLRS
ncbi:MAG: hypothetical protein AB1540_00860 [Bdellovibrionota bacterium]